MVSIGTAAPAGSALAFAPVAQADPIDPPVPPDTPTVAPPQPNVNQGTGDPAHNICVITGHNC
ncbi:hypothetical protein AWC20_22380 [Mycobacterium parmense]|nr:hypothetical protein AWC20_22380 [Mycobacterium parmense]